MDIQFHVVPESFELVEDHLDKWKWVCLFPHDLVELLVVNNRPEFVIFFFEEKQRGPGGMSMINSSSGQVFIDPFLELHVVGLWHWIELGMIWLSSILKLDVKVHPGSVQGKDIKIFLPENIWENGCPVRGGRHDMCNGMDYRARFPCTLSEFYFSGNPINQRIVFPKPIIPKHELVALLWIWYWVQTEMSH